MPYQSAVYLGYQQIVGLSTATYLTLPVGPQQAQATSCNLSGNLLTVGGTITGAFAIGQVVQGAGIPANTTIVAPTQQGPNPTAWWLSAACTTESGETVTGYQDAGANLAYIAPETQNVRYRPGNVAPTSTVGMPIYQGSQVEYTAGDLAALQFIEETATATLNVTYYRVPSVA